MLIRGFVKRRFCLSFALKPIIEIPKIISLPALFEFIEVITKVAVILHFAVVYGRLRLLLRLRNRGIGGVCVVFGLGVQGISVWRDCWRSFFRQWYVGKAQIKPPYVPGLFRCGGSGALRTTSGMASAARSSCACVPGTSP